MVESKYVVEVRFERDNDIHLLDNNIVDTKKIENYFDRIHIDCLLRLVVDQV
jgi:hypothetical protein